MMTSRLNSQPARPSHRRRDPCRSIINSTSTTTPLPPPLDFVSFTFIIDDIVLPNGETHMRQLGGGGAQTLFGYLVSSPPTSSPRCGLAAGVGNDVPASCIAQLQAMKIDTSGLTIHPDFNTPHAWQVFEEDGTRRQLWRSHRELDATSMRELGTLLRPNLDSMPRHFRDARSFHLGVNPAQVPLDLVTALRRASSSRGGLFSLEPYTHTSAPLSDTALKSLVSAADVFSPNELETMCILGQSSPLFGQYPSTAAALDAVRFFLDAGASLVHLRRGAQGSLLATHRDAISIPACAETRVVDVTGCGNASCGGLVRGLELALEKGHASPSLFSVDALAQAGIAGAVAASLMAEHVGFPPLPPSCYLDPFLARSKTLASRVQVLQL